MNLPDWGSVFIFPPWQELLCTFQLTFIPVHFKDPSLLSIETNG